MTKLVELAKVIRSKNAGPDFITFDIIFDDNQKYKRVKKSGAITRAAIARLYNIPESDIIDFIVFDPARAFKFTIKRKHPSGGVGEFDVFGCQQYPPLFDVEIS
jgi:hypothetical protein